MTVGVELMPVVQVGRRLVVLLLALNRLFLLRRLPLLLALILLSGEHRSLCLANGLPPAVPIHLLLVMIGILSP